MKYTGSGSHTARAKLGRLGVGALSIVFALSQVLGLLGTAVPSAWAEAAAEPETVTVTLASGEHGIGLSKRPYFLRQTAKENLQAMNAIKTALDPQHILNNGKSYLTGGNNNAGTF